ncbi:heavy-metal-associated domain-containing protein [soil metagenome]
MSTKSFTVEGMSCGGCVSRVTRILKDIPGVADAHVTLDDKKAIVETNESVAAETVVESLGKQGYKASLNR